MLHFLSNLVDRLNKIVFVLRNSYKYFKRIPKQLEQLWYFSFNKTEII